MSIPSKFYYEKNSRHATRTFGQDQPSLFRNQPRFPFEYYININLKQYKTPVIMGFGPGFRTSVLGYFIKLDVAWGLDTGVVSQRPMYYFSIGLDF